LIKYNGNYYLTTREGLNELDQIVKIYTISKELDLVNETILLDSALNPVPYGLKIDTDSTYIFSCSFGDPDNLLQRT
jgi:hypothetical protein